MRQSVLRQIALMSVVLIIVFVIAYCSLVSGFIRIAPPLAISPSTKVDRIAAEISGTDSQTSLIWVADEVGMSRILLYLSRFNQRTWLYAGSQTAPTLPNRLFLNRNSKTEFNLYFGDGRIGGKQKDDNLDARFTDMSEQEEKELKALIRDN